MADLGDDEPHGGHRHHLQVLPQRQPTSRRARPGALAKPTNHIPEAAAAQRRGDGLQRLPHEHHQLGHDDDEPQRQPGRRRRLVQGLPPERHQLPGQHGEEVADARAQDAAGASTARNPAATGRWAPRARPTRSGTERSTLASLAPPAPGCVAPRLLRSRRRRRAQAQLIDEVDFRREGANAVLQVRFVTPVQYRRALIAARRATRCRSFYDVVNRARQRSTCVPSERRLAGGGAMPDIIVTDESPGARERQPQAGGAAEQARCRSACAPARGDRTIEVVLDRPGHAPSRPRCRSRGARRRADHAASRSRCSSRTARTCSSTRRSRRRCSATRCSPAQREVDGQHGATRSTSATSTRWSRPRRRAQLLLKRFPAGDASSRWRHRRRRRPAAVRRHRAHRCRCRAGPAGPPRPTPPRPRPPAGRRRPRSTRRPPRCWPPRRPPTPQQDTRHGARQAQPAAQPARQPSTREAQALAGDIRAQDRRPVRARAEYETFLQLYPSGPDADRVRAALAALPRRAGARAAAAPRSRPAGLEPPRR